MDFDFVFDFFQQIDVLSDWLVDFVVVIVCWGVFDEFSVILCV